MTRNPFWWITILAMQTAVFAAETSATSSPAQSGFLTGRLASKQVRIWKDMERVALATDAAGNPLHPVLCELYRWAQASGHRIHVEMPARESKRSQVAGRCVASAPAAGQTTSARIILFVEIIDRACTERLIKGDESFIPFVGLTGYERYLETLAHELAHLRLTVRDPSYSAMIDSMETGAQRLLVLAHQKIADESLARQKSDLQYRIRDLSEQVERPAIEVEKLVHAELAASRSMRAQRSKMR